MDAIATGVSLTTYAGESEEFMATPLQGLLEQIAAGTLHIQIGKAFPPDDAGAGWRSQ